MSLSVTRRGRALAALLALVVVGAWASPRADACDTPVYRYAMYRWFPAPYYVFHLHSKPITDADLEVHRAIEAAAQQEDQPANLALTTVDLSDEKELARLDPLVKKVWESQEDRPPSGYLVFSPYGGVLHDGPLQAADVADLVDSPGRQKIAQQLQSGLAMVFVLLTTDDQPANEKAEEEVKALVQSVNSGEIELYSTLGYYPPEEEEAEAEEDAPEDGEKNAEGEGEETEEEGPAAGRQPEHQIGYIKIASDDKAEQWLVRSLLVVEPDLKEFHEPMAFAVYGRGRAMPPFIGKGITRDNMLDCVGFLTAACSCMVKDQNPGMDLLVSYNWDAAAEAVANKFAVLDGGGDPYGGFYPELVIPPTQPEPDAEVASEDTNQEDAEEDASAGEVPSAESANDQTEETTEVKTEAKEESRSAEQLALAEAAGAAALSAEEKANAVAKEAETANVAATRDAENDASTAVAARSSPPASVETRTSYGMWTVGVGALVGLLVLFGATFLVLRPR